MTKTPRTDAALEAHPAHTIWWLCEELESELAALELELDTAKILEDKAFGTLDCYGVPKSRARYVALGIEVLVTRMDKQHADDLRAIHDLEKQIAAKDAECEELRAQMDQYPPA